MLLFNFTEKIIDHLYKEIIEHNDRINDSTIYDLRKKYSQEEANFIYDQIYCRIKASNKLPTFVKSRCLFDKNTLPMSSSELSATMKNDYEGQTCLDLTSGLGVDAYEFTKSFQEVICFEKNENLVNVGKYNQNQLNISNLSWLHADAYHWKKYFNRSDIDLVYIDPQRRTENNSRFFDLKKSIPNVLMIIPEMMKSTRRIIIKTSPIFDYHEGIRILPFLSRIKIISIQNEIKEIIYELNPETKHHQIEAIIYFNKTYYHLINKNNQVAYSSVNAKSYQYLYLPDISIYMGSLLPTFMNTYTPESMLTSNNGVILSNKLYKHLPSRIFNMISQSSIPKKHLKKYLKEKKITHAHIITKNFSLSVNSIRRKYLLLEGGEEYLIFTTNPDTTEVVYHCYRLLES